MIKYILKTKFTVIIDTFFTTICNIATATLPILIMLLFDFDFNSTDGEGLAFIVIILILYAGCILIYTVSQYIAQKFSWKTMTNFSIFVKRDYFEKATKISQTAFDKRSIGEYLSTINNDVKAIAGDWLDPFVDNIRSVLSIIIYSIFLFIFIDWRIAVVLLIASVVSVFLPSLTGKKLAGYRKEHLGVLGGYTSLLQSLLNLRWLVNKKTERAVYKKHEDALVITETALLKFGIQKTLKNVINGFLTYFINICVFAVVAILLLRGEISIGVGVATLGYVESFIWPIKYIMDNMVSISGSKEVRSDLTSFINQEIDSLDAPESFTDKVEFENVAIEYANFSITSLNIQFVKNKKYAIIGQSGSGKSSILRALSKGVDVSSGRILIDEKCIYDIDTTDIIAQTTQDGFVFPASFIDNITTFGSYDASGYEKYKSLVTETMWDTIVSSKDCQSLSSGEKQVVNIIRLLLTDAPVFVCDEPFSALDTENTRMITNHLLSLKDKTVIIVTHDASSEELVGFDEIIKVAR